MVDLVPLSNYGTVPTEMAMTINVVKEWDGLAIPLRTHRNFKVGSVIEMLKSHGVIRAVRNYVLTYDGKLLDVGSAIADYDIKESGRLMVCKRKRFKIELEASDGLITIKVDCTTTVRFVKEKISDALGLPVEKQHLYHGRTLLDNDDRRLVGYVILEPDEDVVFMFLDPDDYTDPEPEPLSDSDSDEIQVDKVAGILDQYRTTMHIFVDIPSRNMCIPLMVDSSYTIDKVKAMLPSIPLGDAHFLFGKELLDDWGSTLNAYGIENLDTIKILHNQTFEINILVPCQDDKDVRQLVLDVKFLDTIADVKLKIQHEVGILSLQQCLKYKGRSLDDTSKLADFAISSRTYFLLVPLLPPAGS